MYEFTFFLFVATLYGRLASEGDESPGTMVAYMLIHLFKGLFVSRLLINARLLLYKRFASKRDEMAATCTPLPAPPGPWLRCCHS